MPVYLSKDTSKPREAIFLVSYCGDDNPDCTDAKPCSACLGMSNVVLVPAGVDFAVVRELAPERNVPPPLRALLMQASRQFRSYAASHRAKETEDGERKAKVNEGWADKLSLAADAL